MHVVTCGNCLASRLIHRQQGEEGRDTVLGTGRHSQGQHLGGTNLKELNGGFDGMSITVNDERLTAPADLSGSQEHQKGGLGARVIM